MCEYPYLCTVQWLTYQPGSEASASKITARLSPRGFGNTADQQTRPPRLHSALEPTPTLPPARQPPNPLSAASAHLRPHLPRLQVVSLAPAQHQRSRLRPSLALPTTPRTQPSPRPRSLARPHLLPDHPPHRSVSEVHNQQLRLQPLLLLRLHPLEACSQGSVRTTPAHRLPRRRQQARPHPRNLYLAALVIYPARQLLRALLRQVEGCLEPALSLRLDLVCSARARPHLLLPQAVSSGRNQQSQHRLSQLRPLLPRRLPLAVFSGARLQQGQPRPPQPLLQVACSVLGRSQQQLLLPLRRLTPQSPLLLDCSEAPHLLEVSSALSPPNRPQLHQQPRLAHRPPRQAGSLPVSVKSQQKHPNQQSLQRQRRRLPSVALHQVQVSLAPNPRILRPQVQVQPPVHRPLLPVGFLLALGNQRTHRDPRTHPRRQRLPRLESPSLALPPPPPAQKSRRRRRKLLGVSALVTWEEQNHPRQPPLPKHPKRAAVYSVSEDLQQQQSLQNQGRPLHPLLQQVHLLPRTRHRLQQHRHRQAASPLQICSEARRSRIS